MSLTCALTRCALQELLSYCVADANVCAVSVQAFDDLSIFSSWPLLPTASGELTALTTLDRSLVTWEPEEAEPSVIPALRKMGLK